jgi:hypothetical protein
MARLLAIPVSYHNRHHETLFDQLYQVSCSIVFLNDDLDAMVPGASVIIIVCIVYLQFGSAILCHLWSEDPGANTIFVGQYFFERLRPLVETLLPGLVPAPGKDLLPGPRCLLFYST